MAKNTATESPKASSITPGPTIDVTDRVPFRCAAIATSRASCESAMPTAGNRRGAEHQRAVDQRAEQRQQGQQPHPLGDRAVQRMRGDGLQHIAVIAGGSLSFCRSTVPKWRNTEMTIARPTAASAAAIVITMMTKTWPPTPCILAKATNERFTALSMSSTHMNRMMAFRRVSTPTTPIAKRIAETNSASANHATALLLGQQDGADDGHQQDESLVSSNASR